MHKKIEAELVSLANSILQMENKDDVITLHKKAQAIYEKLTVLKFVDGALETSTESIEVPKPKEIVEEKVVLDTIQEETIEEEIFESFTEIVNEVEDELVKEEIIFEDEIEETIEAEPVDLEIIEDEEPVFEFEISTEKVEEVEIKKPDSLKLLFEEEFRDAVSADIATNLFEKAHKDNPIIENVQKSEKAEEIKKKSLNDAVFSSNIQVGLNDRIAFVKYLFDGSQEDFNRVLSQLNSFKEFEEASIFIDEIVKPDYDWNGKEEVEQRFKNLIERKFM